MGYYASVYYEYDEGRFFEKSLADYSTIAEAQASADAWLDRGFGRPVSVQISGDDLHPVVQAKAVGRKWAWPEEPAVDATNQFIGALDKITCGDALRVMQAIEEQFGMMTVVYTKRDVERIWQEIVDDHEEEIPDEVWLRIVNHKMYRKWLPEGLSSEAYEGLSELVREVVAAEDVELGGES